MYYTKWGESLLQGDFRIPKQGESLEKQIEKSSSFSRLSLQRPFLPLFAILFISLPLLLLLP